MTILFNEIAIWGEQIYSISQDCSLFWFYDKRCVSCRYVSLCHCGCTREGMKFSSIIRWVYSSTSVISTILPNKVRIDGTAEWIYCNLLRYYLAVPRIAQYIFLSQLTSQRIPRKLQYTYNTVAMYMEQSPHDARPNSSFYAESSGMYHLWFAELN